MQAGLYGVPMTNDEIIKIAESHKWSFLTFQKNIGMLSFVKDHMRINVYITKMTIATAINHPKHGKTQLYRRNVWRTEELNKIFSNPRTHTGKGYYTK